MSNTITSTQNISSVSIDPSEAHYNDLLPDVEDLIPLKKICYPILNLIKLFKNKYLIFNQFPMYKDYALIMI